MQTPNLNAAAENPVDAVNTPASPERPPFQFGEFMLEANGMREGEYTWLYKVLGRVPKADVEVALKEIAEDAVPVTALEILQARFVDQGAYDAFREAANNKGLIRGEEDGRHYAEHTTPFEDTELMQLDLASED